MKAIRWWRIIAAVIGATLALWLLGGDRTPEAASQTRSGTTRIATAFDVTITLLNAPKDPISFYRVGMGNDGAAVISVDPDVPLAKFLAQHHRILLTLEPQ